MQQRGFLQSRGPVMKRYMAGTTMSTAGIPVLGSTVATTDLGSIEPMAKSTQVTAGQMVGLLLDPTGTVAATGTTEAAIHSRVLVNPDLIVGAKASDGDTSGTALTAQATSAASSDGSVCTGVTTLDDGAVYCISGGNANLTRRADDTSGSLSISFPNAIGSGDTFIAVHGFPCTITTTNFITYDLTADLTEINATAAVTDMDNYATYDIVVDSSNPTGNTEYRLIANNHLFGSSSAS